MIRKGIMWTMGLILASIMGYVAWNSVMSPNFLLGETKTVSGKIIDVYPTAEVKTYSRKIKYVYCVNGKYYSDVKKVGLNVDKQAIGNDLQIAYSVKNPKKNKIEKRLKSYTNSNGKKYYAAKNKGYIDLHLINGIFKYKEHVDGGKIADYFVGEYTIDKDSLKLTHYNLEINGSLNKKPKIFVIDPRNRNQLIEFETKNIFRRI